MKVVNLSIFRAPVVLQVTDKNDTFVFVNFWAQCASVLKISCSHHQEEVMRIPKHTTIYFSMIFSEVMAIWKSTLISKSVCLSVVGSHLCTIQYCTVLYCTVHNRTVLYCTVLYCTVQYFTVQYCTL